MMGALTLCSPRVLPYEMVLWDAFSSVPSRATAISPQTMAWWEVSSVVKAIHLVQGQEYLAPKLRGWRHQAVKWSEPAKIGN